MLIFSFFFARSLRFILRWQLGVVNRCVGNAAVYAHNAVQPTQVQPNLVTQTVYGFLDFTTTIGNTVMVFSPQSAPPPGKLFAQQLCIGPFFVRPTQQHSLFCAQSSLPSLSFRLHDFRWLKRIERQ